MERSPLQRAAAGACLLVAALLTVYQFVPGFGHPPPFLYAIFTGLWLFGAAMLWWVPLFGAVGTGAWGALQATQLLLMHQVRPQNVVLALACLAGSALAIAFLSQRLRERRR